MIQEQYDNLPVNFSLTLSIGIEGHARQRFQNEPIMRPRCVGQWNSSDTQPLQQRRGRLDDRQSSGQVDFLPRKRLLGVNDAATLASLPYFFYSSLPHHHHLRSTTSVLPLSPTSTVLPPLLPPVALLLLLLPSRKYSRTVIGRPACAPSEYTCAHMYKCTRMEDVYVRARASAYSVHACE